MEQTASLLLAWYRKNKRELPWRETKDPYPIWLSEIILQQTRVEQGLPYFVRFIAEFPTVHHLAKASEQKVLKCWEGLGYYSRARNLHFTAKYVSKVLHGEFPSNHVGLLKLKGVGPYTAAAISSICFEEPRAVLDGNVFRVLSRLLGIKTPIDSSKGKKDFQELAQQFLGANLPSEFNQAMMEFGAIFCKPNSPDCMNCILKTHCYAGSKDKVDLYPVKGNTTKVRKREFHYFILKFKSQVLIRKRIHTDIWKGLYEFSLIESSENKKPESVLKKFISQRKLKKGAYSIPSPPLVKKHILSHQEIRAHCSLIVLRKKIAFTENEKWVSLNKLNTFPMPRLLLHFCAHLREA